jgi:hypothetical protein
LTEALWLTLQGQGVKSRTPRRIECFFVAGADSAVASLLKGFPETTEWNHEVSRIDDPAGAISVKIISPLAYFSREALLELVDVMMIAAHESGCVFDGFQVDLSDLQQRPWWKFW